MPDVVMEYCERLTPGFWAEPLNASTNVAFLIAAGAAYALWRQRGGKDPWALVLICLAGLTFFGSFAFHALATREAMLADVIPIALFIYGYFYLALRRYFGASQTVACVITAGFAAIATLAGEIDALNGSAGYLPALAALVIMGAYLSLGPSLLIHEAEGGERTGRRLLGAGAVFFVSLCARMVDRLACERIPMGTHFIWHILNAVVLYLLLRAAVLTGPRQAGRHPATI